VTCHGLATEMQSRLKYDRGVAGGRIGPINGKGTIAVSGTNRVDSIIRWQDGIFLLGERLLSLTESV
jgi:hypothetical protein